MTGLGSNTAAKVVPVSSLDWPSSPDELPKAKAQRGTLSYLIYNARKSNKLPFGFSSRFRKDEATNDADDADSGRNDIDDGMTSNGKKSEKKAIDLKKLTPKQLEKLSYYDILGGIKMHSTQKQIKNAFHKACLKYHPDKEESNAAAKESAEGSDLGSDEGGKAKKKGEDPVFLKVKEAFETLSDPVKRKSYDSSVDFDESIPSSTDVSTEADFYRVFGSCFLRNLRFASENDPNNIGKPKKGKQKGKQKRKNGKKQLTGPIVIGDKDTPIDDVHAFYDYWVNFDSWRDFTLAATKLTEHDTDMAECRYEKRWMEKEISRKAKKMKNDEMKRITKLVDKAMALDPRLKREKERIENEKEEKARLKKEKIETEERERKEKEEKEATEKAEREKREKEEKAVMKINKEKEKKILRKSKQAFRKLALAEFQEFPPASIEDASDQIELLCTKLSAVELNDLTAELSDAPSGSRLSIVAERASDAKAGVVRMSKEVAKKREEVREAAERKEATEKAARASKPWVKEELSALAKAVKKYPAGGSNRWDAIAQFVNNLCRQEEPRTKEECIEKFNQAGSAKSAAAFHSTDAAKPSSSATAEVSPTNEASSEWSEEEDKQLQDGLMKYPASMDKNERWAAIAKGVSGRNKKDCVQRYKAIRLALKKK